MAKNEKTWPDPVAPELKPDPNGRGEIENHPAYATIRASRVSSSPGTILFASDFRHRQFVHLEILPADRRRDLSTDWVHPLSRPLVQVALTEAQWATFVSSLNIGEGVPCTLERMAGEAVPGILAVTDRRQQFQDEVQAHLKLVADTLDALDKAVQLPALSGKKQAELRSLIQTARQNLGGNLGFVAECFDEHMEATVERAKAEIHGHIGSVLTKAGLKQLASDMPTPALPMLTDGETVAGCPSPDCPECSGENCRTHGKDPCDCDVVQRHEAPGGER